MISYSPKVLSILIAAILAKIHGDIAIVKGPDAVQGMFSVVTALDADTYYLPEMLINYQSAFNTSIAWLEAAPGQHLKQLIQLNLRYHPVDPALILKAITEALEFGPQYCLQGVSPAARKFANRARAVQHETHRMIGFVRFIPFGDHTLVTKPKLVHNTSDLILRGFQTRYPEHKLVLILDGYAVSIFRHTLKKEAVEPYLTCLEDDSTKELWNRYYQSQYIETRPNITLAQQRIPQKYWDWMQEGEILKNHKGSSNWEKEARNRKPRPHQGTKAPE
jgi:probable DNA metabolism protein